MRPVFEQLYERLGKDGAVRYLAKLGGYVEIPPTFEQFIEDDYFMGRRLGKGKLWPIWKDVLMGIFPHPIYSQYREVVLTGSIGSGKTTAAAAGVCYDLC